MIGEGTTEVKLGRGQQRRPRAARLATAGLLLFLGVFFVYPLLLAVKSGFVDAEGELTFLWLSRTLQNELIREELLNSFLLACVTTLMVIVIALPPAMISARCSFKGQRLLTSLLLVPLILPPFVGALSVQRIFAQFGTLNLLLERLGIITLAEAPDWLGSGFLPTAILQALHLFPIMFLNTTAALANLDPAYVQSARNLGAGPGQTFLRITLPLLRPGLFAGGSIVFIWAFTDIGTPLMVGYESLTPVRIFRELASSDLSPRTYSLVFILLVLSVLFYVTGKFLFGRTDEAESAKASVAQEMKRLGWGGTLGAWAVFGVIIFAALLPHIGVMLTAFSERWLNTILPQSYTLTHMRFVLEQPETRTSILNSLKYASVSTLVDIAAGATAAWLIVRSKPWGAKLLDGLVMLPLAVPGLILAAGFVAMTVKGSMFESIGPMRNPFVILIIAYAVRRMPFVVRGVAAGLQQVPESLEQAARNLGAGPRKTFFKITVPLILANIIAAGVLTFSFAMLEVSDSLVLAQLQEHYPITKEIYSQAMSANVDSHNLAAALGVYGMVLLGGSMALAGLLMGKKLGAIFRI